MTSEKPASLSTDPESEASSIVLRGTPELRQVPPERPPAPPKTAAAGNAATVFLASLAEPKTAWPAAVALPRRMVAAPPPELTWLLASAALAAAVGWVCERRRRLGIEMDGDSARSTGKNKVRQATDRRGAGETFPDGRDIVEASSPVYVSVIGDTPSRREATLVDLHELRERLQRLCARREFRGAAELLEQHLVDFRYTSPWVFLELRELYRQLDRRQEWELVRDAYRGRFGQNAPQWDAPSTAGEEIASDKQLSGDLVRKWPQREARMFILRWMLGDALSRQKAFGPPQLALGVYREMLTLDAVLDELMTVRTVVRPGAA
ncbi:MAG: hypothetical protein JWQ13_1167 [Ramlibacter sp.]|nr:hypothetical protein [Ramlibacter sp.]